MDDIYPGQTWLKYADPAEAGFSAEKLAQARQYADEIGSEAVMVIYKGAVVAHWGPVETRFMCHSVRKSFLSALYGIHVDKGNIDLDDTMAELGIDDADPLTESEKQARIRDLLKARSGVYHPAAYETAAMKEKRPQRGSHTHGTFYYYNNWDFNVLGSIFDQKTNSTIFQEFKTQIAEPLQMQDFRVRDGYYHLEKQHSSHPAYPFRMSARDMARFGLLFLREGKWKGQQIISKAWVRKSTTSYSTVDSNSGYGYLWWTILTEPFKSLGAYGARGYGGHDITVVPGADLVFVHRVNTWWNLGFTRAAKGTEHKVGSQERLKLLGMILDAKVSEPKTNATLVPLVQSSTDAATLDRYVGNYEFPDNFKAQVKLGTDGNLLIHGAGAGTFALIPHSKVDFVMEDIKAPVRFEFGDDGKPVYMSIEFTPGEKCFGVAVTATKTEPNALELLTRKLDTLTPALMAKKKVPEVSIALIWNGRLAWQKGYGVVDESKSDKVTPMTVFEACSMSKVVFTYAVLKLAEQGKIDLDKPLVEYLPEPYLKNEPLHKLITARMVMTHTTGFPNWRKGGLQKGGPLPVQFKPGTKYGYSGEGYYYLQLVVEQITGKSLNTLMHEMLLEPAEMDSSSYVWEQRFDKTASAGHDKAGKIKKNRPLYRQANAAYSLYCTPSDYARFIIEVMKDDRSGKYSLGQKSIKNMLTPYIKIEGSYGEVIPRPGSSGYVSVHRGLGWVIGKKKGKSIRAWHSGSNGSGFQCHSEFDPQKRSGIVIMTGSVNGRSLYYDLIQMIDFP
ncbi:MAG: serine hydrolase [Sedimentisphaerales bacterium]|nr:serine hydrolase [Sedimentisphaerales bacterium]